MANETGVIKTLLKGLAVGDGCTGLDGVCGSDFGGSGPGYYWDYRFMAGHGQMSNKRIKAFNETCNMTKMLGYG